MTKVIHIRSSSKSADEIYIGRAGKGRDGYWGNPIKIGYKCKCGEVHNDGGSTLSCYSLYLDFRLSDAEFKSKFLALKDKTLVCFCKPNEGFKGRLICHGQIMAARLDGVLPTEIE